MRGAAGRKIPRPGDRGAGSGPGRARRRGWILDLRSTVRSAGDRRCAP